MGRVRNHHDAEISDPRWTASMAFSSKTPASRQRECRARERGYRYKPRSFLSFFLLLLVKERRGGHRERKPPAVLPRFLGLRSLRWSLIPAWVLVAAPRGDLVGGSELMNSRDVCNDGIDYRERPLYPSFSQITSNLRVFTFSELRNATRNFSRSLMVGEGRRNRDEGEKRMVRWDRLLQRCGRRGNRGVMTTAAEEEGEEEMWRSRRERQQQEEREEGSDEKQQRPTTTWLQATAAATNDDGCRLVEEEGKGNDGDGGVGQRKRERIGVVAAERGQWQGRWRRQGRGSNAAATDVSGDSSGRGSDSGGGCGWRRQRRRVSLAEEDEEVEGGGSNRINDGGERQQERQQRRKQERATAARAAAGEDGGSVGCRRLTGWEAAGSRGEAEEAAGTGEKEEGSDYRQRLPVTAGCARVERKAKEERAGERQGSIMDGDGKGGINDHCRGSSLLDLYRGSALLDLYRALALLGFWPLAHLQPQVAGGDCNLGLDGSDDNIKVWKTTVAIWGCRWR
ncbi:hypothetical protein BHE74_00032725 [Ensete ventricosum]|nr:hypothetical protein BHE74_00032725 [Ensete ventricosum]